MSSYIALHCTVYTHFHPVSSKTCIPTWPVGASVVKVLTHTYCKHFFDRSKIKSWQQHCIPLHPCVAASVRGLTYYIGPTLAARSGSPRPKVGASCIFFVKRAKCYNVAFYVWGRSVGNLEFSVAVITSRETLPSISPLLANALRGLTDRKE